MTQNEQKGYADQMTGAVLDQWLMRADTPAAREYRAGARAARRNQSETAPFDHTARPAGHAQITPQGDSNRAEPDHPSAFSDPIPGKHKPKRAKPEDPDQLGLL